jgi:GNAT superfamily N-acetyltransferase
MISIEAFEPRDVEPLVHLWRESFEHGVGITDPNPFEAQIDYFWKEIAPGNRVRIARRGGQMVGVLASNAGSVNLLYVRVGVHRQGIGKQLLDLAKDASCGELWLYTFARNRVACAFYESQGFVVAQRGYEAAWQLEDVRFTWSRSQA